MMMGESYTALSQRQAQLISEPAKSSDSSGGSTQNRTSVESSVDRLQISRVNQEEAGQMALEYGKTVHLLESNLSNARASLAIAESNLLEKETKCAYTDTVNQQLHSRVQKLMDRESNTKTYLRTLEARLDDQSSGEEKNGAIIFDLHKEIARIRESESNAEDYISTLEERLVEADQDMEILQREVDRLEHVVDRQRSLGKLDNLLYELDHIQHNSSRPDSGGSITRATNPRASHQGPERNASLETLKEAQGTALPEESDGDLLTSAESEDEDEKMLPTDDFETLVKATASQSLAVKQSRVRPEDMTEKVQSIASELFELRLQHENTLNELNLMSAKYQEALRTLTELQDVGDEVHNLPDSPTSLRRTSRPKSLEEEPNVIPEASIPLPSSQSLSSEMSLPDEDNSVDGADTTQSSRDFHSREGVSPDVDKLQRMLAEHEHGMGLVTQQYAQLQAEYQQTLETVEDLKAEIQKTKAHQPPSPSHISPVIRRGTSQNIVLTERANRSLASLRTLLSEELEGRPSKVETAELHLNSASHELQLRGERIQSLEAEIKNVKKEMDSKMTIISGLTRERNSLKGSSPVELSMVSQMRNQLIQNENEIRSLHENHAAREEELLAEINSLKGSRGNREDSSLSIIHGDDQDHHPRFSALPKEVSEWQSKHQAAVDSAQTSEKQLQATTAELEASLANMDAIRAQQGGDSQDAFQRAAAAKAMQVEREKHTELIDSLQRDMEEHRSSAARLEQRNSSMRQLVAQYERELQHKDEKLTSHDEMVIRKEREALELKATVESHKQGLKSLHETHAIKMEEIKLSHAGQLADLDDQQLELTRIHQQAVVSLNTQLEKSRSDLHGLLSRAGGILGHATSVDMLHNHIQDLLEEKSHAMELHARLNKANTELEKQVEGYRKKKSEVRESSGTTADYQTRIRGLAEEIAKHEEALREKDEIIKKRDAMIESISVEKRNNARIIEELEQQIETSFDHHHNRLSVIQQQGNQALVEAQARIVSLEKDVDSLRGGSDVDATSCTYTMKSAYRPQSPQTDGQNRSSSMTSNLRKSASAASLPSPPPAIPLPPLPALPSLSSIAALNGLNTSNGSTSPQSSRHTSKEIPATANQQAQLIEDQEARIRTIEKHLNAEKQLTATLEEALVDLETQSNKLRGEMDGWKKKAWSTEEELHTLRREKKNARESMQAVEMERDKRREAEAARAQLEERMNQLSRKKKKNTLNCF